MIAFTPDGKVERDIDFSCDTPRYLPSFAEMADALDIAVAALMWIEKHGVGYVPDVHARDALTKIGVKL